MSVRRYFRRLNPNNGRSNNQTQSFTFSIIIGPEGAGTYDMTFVEDPNNTTGDGDRNNNTFTGVIVVN